MKLNRRKLTHLAMAIAAASTAPWALAADVVKIGFVSPQTGPLAPFGEADKWVIQEWHHHCRHQARSADYSERQSVQPQSRRRGGQ
jgi:hypothetical protein